MLYTCFIVSVSRIAADRSAAAACGVAETARQGEKSINKDVRDGAVSGKSHENEAISGFPVPGRGRAGPFVGRRSRLGLKGLENGPNEGGGVYAGWWPGKQNGNPGLYGEFEI